MKFCGFRRFNVNPSGAPRQLPLHKGAYDCTCFFLCATEKTKGKFKASKPKTAKNRKSRTLLQALRASSLSEGAYVCARFFLCTAEKEKGKFKTSPPKNSRKTQVSHSPSGAPRQLPLHKGAMSRCDFRLCAAEKAKGKFKTSPPKNSRKTQVALSLSCLRCLKDSIKSPEKAPKSKTKHRRTKTNRRPT